MPSIRVKRNDYATLGGGGPRNEATRPLTSIFHWPQVSSPIEGPSSSIPQPSHENVSHDSRSQSLSLGPTAPGLVRDHVNKKPLRRHTPSHGFLSLGRQSKRSESRPNGSNSRDDLVTIQGASGDLRVHHQTGETPSVLESALSLPLSSIGGHAGETQEHAHHHDDIVEHLDVIDPQVATVSNLTNAANSLLIPPFSFYSRRPVVVLDGQSAAGNAADAEHGRVQFEDDLDRHVDDVLRKRARIKRMLLGVWSFLKTPLGIITGIYGFCVVFWGAAIVFFLAKFINFHNADLQGFWVEVSCQVTNGLFTVTGVGFIPARILDTYRISKIIHYKRKTRRLRREANLPALLDEDDLPDPIYDPNYVHVLTEKEQDDLHYQQDRFHHHQTWYRAHGTETHRAFPINYALLICLFNDGNSIFQCLLCGCMWGMNRFLRPAWTTGCLIPFSFLCGIIAGVLIGVGGSKTKRTQKVEKMMREALGEVAEKSNEEHSRARRQMSTTIEETEKDLRNDVQKEDQHVEAK